MRYAGAMLRALILALTLLLAFPGAGGASTCHDGAMSGMMPGMSMAHIGATAPHRGQPVAAEHLCVGCVAADRRVAAIAPPVWSPAMVPMVEARRLSFGRDGPPLTPPPRV